MIFRVIEYKYFYHDNYNEKTYIYIYFYHDNYNEKTYIFIYFQIFPNHTWQSMKEHYVKRIIPQYLDQLNLTVQEMKLLLNK